MRNCGNMYQLDPADGSSRRAGMEPSAFCCRTYARRLNYYPADMFEISAKVTISLYKSLQEACSRSCMVKMKESGTLSKECHIVGLKMWHPTHDVG